MALSYFNLSRAAFISAICAAAGQSCAASDNPQSLDSLGPLPISAEFRLPDFSYAGYNNGIGTPPILQGTVIDVTRYGVIANDTVDDTAAMIKALDAAHDTRGPVVVRLPEGKIIISGILKIQRGDIVLRGAGSGKNGTHLHVPRPLKMVDSTDSLDELREYLVKYDKRQKEKDKNINELFSEYSWSGGFIWVQKAGTRAAAYLESHDPDITVLANAVKGEAGSVAVSVADASDLEAGDVVELQWLNKQGENGPLLQEIYGDTDLKIGSHHWTFEARPLVRQKTKIIAVNGTDVTLSDPLLHKVSPDIPAQFAKWDHIEQVGIEDLRITFPPSPYYGHHLESGYNGIYFTSVYDGWIRDVTFENSDTGVLTYNSANVTISNIETIGERDAHYSVHAGNVHNVLVENLTVNNAPIHSLSFNTQSTRSVFKDAVVNHGAVLDQHAGANHQNLFDNITLNIDAKRDEDGPFYPVWDGSGAGYWQPGHGRYNTTWNLKVNIRSGASRDETVRLLGLAEGPDARIVGVSGNRDFEVTYVPAPYTSRTNADMNDIPSLYEYQLTKRKR